MVGRLDNQHLWNHDNLVSRTFQSHPNHPLQNLQSPPVSSSLWVTKRLRTLHSHNIGHIVQPEDHSCGKNSPVIGALVGLIRVQIFAEHSRHQGGGSCEFERSNYLKVMLSKFQIHKNARFLSSYPLKLAKDLTPQISLILDPRSAPFQDIWNQGPLWCFWPWLIFTYPSQNTHIVFSCVYWNRVLHFCIYTSLKSKTSTRIQPHRSRYHWLSWPDGAVTSLIRPYFPLERRWFSWSKLGAHHFQTKLSGGSRENQHCCCWYKKKHIPMIIMIHNLKANIKSTAKNGLLVWWWETSFAWSSNWRTAVGVQLWRWTTMVIDVRRVKNCLLLESLRNDWQRMIHNKM